MSRRDDHHTDTRLADLADGILAVARLIVADVQRDQDTVPLTPTEVNVMRYVDRHHGTSPTAVAAATGLQRSNLSRVLRDLEAKGMVARTVDESDARGARLVPTAQAAANLQRLQASWTRLLTSIELDPRNLEATLVTLRELEAGLAPGDG